MLTRSHIVYIIQKIVRSTHNYLDIVWAIQAFNKAFEIKPNRPLYVKLIAEETYEFVEELVLGGVGPELLKELSDILYVLEGLLDMIEDEELPDDIDQDELQQVLDTVNRLVVPVAMEYFTPKEVIRGFLETHKSNMSKLDGNGNVLRREDGKVMKSDLYKPADLSDIFSPYMFLENEERYLKG